MQIYSHLSVSSFDVVSGLLDVVIKYMLGFTPNTPDKVIEKEWKRRIRNVCKPCWEIRYCPYGPLVEDLPMPRITREEAIKHNEFLKEQLDKGVYTGPKREFFEKNVKEFDPSEYPERRSKLEEECSCIPYGHFCPVFFISEPVTETKEPRRVSKYVPRDMAIRVVRRDGNICQICGRLLLDREIQIDHIVPVSKGGSTTESNLRATCKECNRSKKDRIDFGLIER